MVAVADVGWVHLWCSWHAALLSPALIQTIFHACLLGFLLYNWPAARPVCGLRYHLVTAVLQTAHFKYGHGKGGQ